MKCVLRVEGELRSGKTRVIRKCLSSCFVGVLGEVRWQWFAGGGTCQWSGACVLLVRVIGRQGRGSAIKVPVYLVPVLSVVCVML